MEDRQELIDAINQLIEFLRRSDTRDLSNEEKNEIIAIEGKYGED